MAVSLDDLETHYKGCGSIAATARHFAIDRRGVARRLRSAGVVNAETVTASESPKNGPRRHIVIPDAQVKPGQSFEFLRWVGKYIADMEPDVVVQIGDFADMPSLSSYDKGKRSFEGRRYRADVDATKEAMAELMSAVSSMPNKPALHLTLGNHEDRINRATQDEPMLDGTIGIADLGYESHGWTVHDYLKPVTVDGISYAHFFTSGVMGRPVSSARALATKKHQSCVMGHVQKVDMHRETRADGTPFWGLFSGCCYMHDEEYLGPQGNAYWRGVWVLNEVCAGDFQPMMVSLDYLRRTYV
jgi:hypothetical protein